MSWVETTLREAQTIRMSFRLAQEGDPSVVAVVRERAKRNAEIIRDLLQQGIHAREIRTNLDPRLGAASLVGMVLFAATSPVLFSATSLQNEPKLIERFAAHTADMFIDGVAAEKRTRRPNRQRR